MVFGRVFSCNELHATGRVIPYCSVHLDARMIPPRYGMKCGGFITCFFVQQVARYGEIPPRYGMKCGDFCACFFVQRVARYGDKVENVNIFVYNYYHLKTRRNDETTRVFKVAESTRCRNKRGYQPH